MSTEKLNFGVLYLPSCQLLDYVGPMDYINMHSKEFLQSLGVVPQPIVDSAPSLSWHFISHDMAPRQMSSGPPQHPTTTYTDCPQLDYLLIPGPDPAQPMPENCDAFVKKQFPGLKALLLVCSGSIVVGNFGVLDGLSVCSNKFTLKIGAEKGFLNKNVKWVGDRRWIIDGKVWSAAGVTSGIDLAVEFSRVHFSPESVTLVRELAEYHPNPAQPDKFAYLVEGVEL